QNRAALILRYFVRLDQAVGSGEVDGLSLEVGLALARAATRVVDRDFAVYALEALDRRFVERLLERGAGAVECGRRGTAAGTRGAGSAVALARAAACSQCERERDTR